MSLLCDGDDHTVSENSTILNDQETKSLVTSSVKYNMIMSPDMAWIGRLITIQKDALNKQYQLACLSTMGGAYHICNYPKEALVLAVQQENIGRRIGAVNIIVRAKTYQCLNLALLGQNKRAKRTLRAAKDIAQGNKTLLSYCDTIEKWMMYKQKHPGKR